MPSLWSVWVVFVVASFFLGIVGIVAASIWLWWPEWASERWARRSLGRRLEGSPTGGPVQAADQSGGSGEKSSPGRGRGPDQPGRGGGRK